MKISRLLPISAFALLCLFSLQAFWLYYTYQLHLGNIKESVNLIFYQMSEKELDQRFFELEKKIAENLPYANVRIDSFDIASNALENKSLVSQQFDVFQKLMANYNIRFNVVSGDSIFRSLLQLNRLPFCFRINYLDSTGIIVETVGKEIKGGFKTAVFPVINGEKIYADVKITAPTVFRNMLLILSVSILIFFFIITCIIYEMKVFLNHQYLSQLRDNFTHALTHDMKTPLSTIHSVLDQLEKGIIDKDQKLRKKFCSIGIEKVLNLQNTVNQILTLAYIDKKQITLDKQLVNLPAMIQSLIEGFTIKVGKVVTFQTSYILESINIYADAFYLNNALSNLIDNAIKYSNDPVEILIECVSGEKQVKISVKDNGFGISQKDQMKIFNRFERGAEIKRNQISGFGIGLNYVQQVIEAHGGSITLSSQERVGSEFIITLPIQIKSTEEDI